MTATSKHPLFAGLLRVVRGAVAGSLLHVFIEAEPAPASRPIFSKWGGGVHYTPSYQNFYSACQQQLGRIKAGSKDGLFVVGMEFLHTRARTSKLLTPRGDCDNLAKGPLDAMTKVEKAWKDDTQVSHLVVAKRFLEPRDERPGVHIYWGNL